MVFAFVIVGSYGTKVLELLRNTFFWRGLDIYYFKLLGDFWEPISHFTSSAKISEMALNLLPSIKKTTPKKSPKPTKTSPKPKRKRNSAFYFD
jgi:hypothetical protein